MSLVNVYHNDISLDNINLPIIIPKLLFMLDLWLVGTDINNARHIKKK